jgi:hypothetical protein
LDAQHPTALCECGCGEPAPLATRNCPKRGYVKGQPHRFIAGHQWRKHGPLYEERSCGYAKPCWVWMRSLTSTGYGQWNVGRHRTLLAHRILWEDQNGPIPEGLELDHLCRNPRCVNPEHLEAVTHVENLRRAVTTKLTPDLVREIRASSADALSLAQRYGVSRRTIYSVRAGTYWKDVA